MVYPSLVLLASWIFWVGFPCPLQLPYSKILELLMLLFSKGEACYKPKPHLQHCLTLAQNTRCGVTNRWTSAGCGPLWAWWCAHGHLVLALWRNWFYAQIRRTIATVNFIVRETKQGCGEQGAHGAGKGEAGISTPCALSQFHPCKREAELENWDPAVPSSFGHLSCTVWQDHSGKSAQNSKAFFSKLNLLPTSLH